MITDNTTTKETIHYDTRVNASFKIRLLKRSILFYKRQMEVLEELLKDCDFNEESFVHKEYVVFFLLQLERCKMDIS